jgi:DNA-binding NtrC family response regulator
MRHAAILIVDDDREVLRTVAELVREAGYRTATAVSTRAARQEIEADFIDLLVLDERIGVESGIRFLAEERQRTPGISGLMITGHADMKYAIAAMRAGALDLLEKPFDNERLIEAIARGLSASQVTREARFQRWKAANSAGFSSITADSTPMRRAIEDAKKAAVSRASVLLLGESGTGKDVFAKAIHEESLRKNGPCVIVNAGTISPSLVESTLFGHTKGAFTGADRDRPGLFEQAHSGTLFLDEIGEMPLDLQVKLLRVIEDGLVTRLGSARPLKVDVRLITATNRDLKAEAAAGKFRKDLYYRLAGFPIHLPPLRERGQDIVALANRFLAKHAEENHLPVTGFSDEAVRAMLIFPWPGNVRELDFVVRRAALRTASAIVGAEDLDLGPAPALRSITETGDGLVPPYRKALEEFERAYFSILLSQCGQNKAEAARLAGLDRTSLYSHLRKLPGFTQN